MAASNQIEVHLTHDDLKPAFDAIAEGMAQLRAELAAVRDGLDAWAGRIQRLEALEAQAANDK